MNNPEYQTIWFVYAQGGIFFNTLRDAEEQALYNSTLRPLSVHAVQHSSGDLKCLYINGKRFVPGVESES